MVFLQNFFLLVTAPGHYHFLSVVCSRVCKAFHRTSVRILSPQQPYEVGTIILTF